MKNRVKWKSGGTRVTDPEQFYGKAEEKTKTFCFWIDVDLVVKSCDDIFSDASIVICVEKRFFFFLKTSVFVGPFIRVVRHRR